MTKVVLRKEKKNLNDRLFPSGTKTQEQPILM